MARTQKVIPFIAYEDAAAAIDWLTDSFGFHENRDARVTGDDGTIGHAEMDVGGGEVIFLSTPTPDYVNPKRHREQCDVAAKWSDNPWVIDGLCVLVDNVDAHHEHAVAAGATVLRPPEDVPPAGIRLWSGEDLEGHRWMFVHPLQS